MVITTLVISADAVAAGDSNKSAGIKRRLSRGPVVKMATAVAKEEAVSASRQYTPTHTGDIEPETNHNPKTGHLVDRRRRQLMHVVR